MESLDYWKFLAGLGLFLYGMLHLEEALKELGGKKFKLFLKKYTTNRVFSILNGIVATVILQSSSVVLLMVIAFAGAGIISLRNSLGIILGANLGTTMTGFIVSAFGFKSNLDQIVLPMIGMGILGMIFASRRFLFYHFFGFLAALGLLFMGLGFMKDGMQDMSQLINMEQMIQFGFLGFLVFGMVMTAIIQSSSAMMGITLSALYSNVIPIEYAIYIVIGANIGTTTTGLFASLTGTPVKKRVALAHIFFSIVTSGVALLIAQPLLQFIHQKLGVYDNLYSLVNFHMFFNLIGVLLFFPFLGLFENFLNRFFVINKNRVNHHIYKVSPDVPEAAIEAIRLELVDFVQEVTQFNAAVLGIKTTSKKSTKRQPPGASILAMLLTDADLLQNYERLKRLEGELLDYFAHLQKQMLDPEVSNTLNQYVLALRNGVQSAKSIKDIKHNLSEFQESVVEIIEHYLEEIQKEYASVHSRILRLWTIQEPHNLAEELIGLLSTNEVAYNKTNAWIYEKTLLIESTDINIASLLNVNREIFTANHLLVDALRGILLTHQNNQFTQAH